MRVIVVGGGNSATGKEESLDVDGAFNFIGLTPNTAYLKGSNVREGGFIFRIP